MGGSSNRNARLLCRARGCDMQCTWRKIDIGERQKPEMSEVYAALEASSSMRSRIGSRGRATRNPSASS